MISIKAEFYKYLPHFICFSHLCNSHEMHFPFAPSISSIHIYICTLEELYDVQCCVVHFMRQIFQQYQNQC